MKPPPLIPGQSRIAVVAPAGPPSSPESVRRGIERLTTLGFHVSEPGPWTPDGYLAGTDSERLAALNDALRDPAIDAIFCVRGGYGTLRLLPDVDYEAARRRPTLVVGYSDITALQLALLARAGMPSLSGPMVAVDWPDLDLDCERQFRTLIAGRAPSLALEGAAMRPLCAGVSRGRLIGGNLTMIARLAGTPYLPALDGAILFVEDVGEAPYRIDGLFAQLRLAGLLERLAGVVLGGFTGYDDPGDNDPNQVPRILDHYFGNAPYPVAAGLPYGHFPRKIALPIGIEAELNVGARHA